MKVKARHLFRKMILGAIIGVALSGCFAAIGAADPAAGPFALGNDRITDAAGRKIDASRVFVRIISLYGAHTENIYSLKAGNQLIGVGRNESWPPGVAAKPVFSYHDDLEKFLAARPDLVLIRPMIDRGYGRLMAQLEKHGITVVSLQPGSIDEMLAYWRALGALTGHCDEAEKMVKRFTDEVQRIRLLVSQVQDKKQVYFEAIHDRMRTFTPDAMPVFALETAGGINVAADAPSRRGTNIADYGKERILSRGRDIHVYLAQVGPMNRPTIEMIKAEPGYHLIRAVQEDQVYLIDEQLVSRPTLRILTGICRIGQILYPRLFENEIQPIGGREMSQPAAMTTVDKEDRP